MLYAQGVTMKTTKALLVLVVALAGFAGASSAFAQHRHYSHGPRISIGFGFGVPYAYPYYYYPPYYAPYYSYYPAPVVVQQSPVYVEQNPQSAPAAQPSPTAGYWYYCSNSRAYYPYVKECASGWQRVAPQPG
jgi:hypothetical protein